MGQATIDLPDPSQMTGIDAGPLSPEALASADDLLSQLAGDDIDRLLAEADSDRPPVVMPPVDVAPSAVETPLPAPAVTNATVETPAPVSSAIDSAAATAAALDAILAPAIESSLQAVEKQLNEVTQAIAEANAPSATAAPAPESAPTVVDGAAAEPSFEALDEKLLNEAAAHVASIMDVPATLPQPMAEPATPAQATDSAERQALTEPLVVPEAADKSPGRLSLLVKILELINSPMLLVSDEVRDAIGKVALLTTFNAAAVIVYVMVFRRPHH